MLIYLISYVAVHVATFIFFRYYMLQEIFDTVDNPKINKDYPLFRRNDIQKMGIIRSFPFYITYWPILLLGQFIILTGGLLSVILMIGVKDTSKTSGPRYHMMKATIRFVSRSIIYLFGYFWIEIEQDHSMCYK